MDSLKSLDLLKRVGFLVSRLERVSADSVMAHKVSGIRGSLLKVMDSDVGTYSQEDLIKLESMISIAYDYLKQACREVV